MPKYSKTTLLTKHPHDAYFKIVFSKKENVITFLNYFLAQDKFLAQNVIPLIDGSGSYESDGSIIEDDKPIDYLLVPPPNFRKGKCFSNHTSHTLS